MEKRIVITGFMAAGKTTIVRELGLLLASDAVDLDDLIVQRHGRSISRIIEEDGEAAFRDIESEMLREVLTDNSTRIIALGGGAWTVERNRDLVSQFDCVSVWLDTPFDICWSRIGESNGTRPLARDRESTYELYKARRKIYESANIRMPVSESDAEGPIARRIIEQLLRE